MRNLSEKKFWKAIRLRLENYSEEAPDDDWDKIAAALPVTKKPGYERLNSTSDLLAVSGILLLLATAFITPIAENTERVEQVAVPLPESKAKVASALDPNTALMKPPTKDGQYAASVERHPEVKQERLVSMPGTSLFPLRRTQGETKKPVSQKNESRHREEMSTIPGAIPATAGLTSTMESGILGEGHTPDNYATLGSLQPDSSITSVPVDSGIVYYSVPPILERRKPRRKFRPSVYVMATPSLAYQKVIPVRNDAINIQELNGGGVFSGNRFGVGLDAGFQMQVSSRLELYASISYYTQRQSILYSYTSGENMSVSESKDAWSYSLTPETTTQQFNYNMRNAGAGAGVLYHLYGRKLMHKIGGGLQYQQGLIRLESEGSYNNAESSYLNYQLLYRMELVVRARAHFFLQPTFTHVITLREHLSEPFEIMPYRAGIGFGVVYHF